MMNKLSACNLVVIIALLLNSCSSANKTENDLSGNVNKQLSIIPQPKNVTLQKGHFEWNANTTINLVNASKEMQVTAAWLNNVVGSATGFSNVIVNNETATSDENSIVFNEIHEKEGSPEGYSLKVSKHQIYLTGRSEGLFYAVQTLLQMMPAEVLQKTTKLDSVVIPCAEINDEPRFAYRGMHLDVSRNFLPKEFLYKYIDLLAMYKFNRFHLHLTDGAGWRLEIKKYPELTRKTAFRAQPDWKGFWMEGNRKFVDEGTPNSHGGYYTQDDMRKVIAYASSKFITIVPEIELPGHSEEVFVAYPELSCSGKPYVNGDFCAGNEATFKFLEDVFSEVIDLFPSEYIHIGGDEAGKSAWKKCPKCKKRMKEEKLNDVDELQSYFIKRIEKFVLSKNRRVIGWDEILEGGLAPEATVMSWRGETGGIEAAKQGHDIIMTPGNYCYFDHYQSDPTLEPEAISGYTPLRVVYAYEPVPAELPDSCVRHLLGAQANLWTEYIPTQQYAEYMVFPRMLALSEVVWSPKEARNWTDFKHRLQDNLLRLSYLDVNYYKPTCRLELFENVDNVNGRIGVTFENELDKPVIRYTTDGTVPTNSSTLYEGEFFVQGTAQVNAAVFVDNQKQEPVLSKLVSYHKAVGKKVTYNKLFNDKYPAGGESALVDAYRGGFGYSDGKWQGFLSNVDVVIDLGEEMTLNSFAANFMQITGPGVFMPKKVEVSLSSDGKKFKTVLDIPNDVSKDISRLTFKNFEGSLEGKKARYVKVEAKNTGGFLFVDELIIN